MSIIPDLTDMMSDTVTVQPVIVDEYGKATNNGTPTAVQCYISGKETLLREANGRERVSTVKVTLAGVFDFNCSDFRYTLPSRYDPNTDLVALDVKTVQDENGPHHQVIFFP